jgi:hypothetical protein
VDLITIGAAAERLGVSVRQARNLAANGEVLLLARGVVEADSVSAYLRDRGVVARRVWGGETAWAAIGLLARIDVTWLGAEQGSRLRRRVSSMDSAELTSRVRNRSTTYRFDGHRSVVERVGNELMRGSTLIGGLSVDRGVDGYLDATCLSNIVDRFQLRVTSSGPITIRTTHHLSRARKITEIDAELLSAVDLASAKDAREREAALSVITNRIAAL